MALEPPMKAKTHRLFEEDEPDPSLAAGPRRSFAECLRTTPADPLSPVVKAALWAIGVVVILLLIAALVTGGGRKPKPRPDPTVHLGPPRTSIPLA